MRAAGRQRHDFTKRLGDARSSRRKPSSSKSESQLRPQKPVCSRPAQTGRRQTRSAVNHGILNGAGGERKIYRMRAVDGKLKRITSRCAPNIGAVFTLSVPALPQTKLAHSAARRRGGRGARKALCACRLPPTPAWHGPPAASFKKFWREPRQSRFGGLFLSKVWWKFGDNLLVRVRSASSPCFTLFHHEPADVAMAPDVAVTNLAPRSDSP
jgi:hypothetical protein